MKNPSHGTAAGTIAARDRVVQILELLETRMLHSSARPLIASTGMHASRGWTETLSRARLDVHSDAVWNQAYKSLSLVAINHTYVGNKHVHIYDLREQGEAAKKEVLDWARVKAISDLQPILKKRPFDILGAPTVKDGLEPFKSVPPQLIAADFVADKLYLQFFTTRAYSLREELDISKMSAAQARTFAEYQELIGVKWRQVPCFDTVVVDIGKELVEFRTDFQPGMTEDKKALPYVGIMNELNRMTTKFIDRSAVNVGLMNFFPAIDKLYRDQSCGRVTALGFVATSRDTSSNNHGQIHRRRTQDFRKDHFHVGGKKAVNAVTPYAIGITWDQPGQKADLGLELRGSVRAIYSGADQGVAMAEIMGCMDASDYEFVVGHMLNRLSRRPK
ncbi:hypothetical protein [Roseateles sp.]|uniref:hypothetical protein n=1 Tax=Roseateles sp. TaxID=1971397 RepID=UPI00391890B6